jgi:hypothetical protein
VSRRKTWATGRERNLPSLPLMIVFEAGNRPRSRSVAWWLSAVDSPSLAEMRTDRVRLGSRDPNTEALLPAPVTSEGPASERLGVPTGGPLHIRFHGVAWSPCVPALHPGMDEPSQPRAGAPP